MPLDVLVVDTDFKSPNPWNGWQWTQVFSTNPEGFLRWAHAKGLDVALNVHPSISTKDPAYAAADAAAGGLDRDGGRCGDFIAAEAAGAVNLRIVRLADSLGDAARAAPAAAVAWLLRLSHESAA